MVQDVALNSQLMAVMEKRYSINIDVSPDLDEKTLKDNTKKLDDAWSKRE